MKPSHLLRGIYGALGMLVILAAYVLPGIVFATYDKSHTFSDGYIRLYSNTAAGSGNWIDNQVWPQSNTINGINAAKSNFSSSGMSYWNTSNNEIYARNSSNGIDAHLQYDQQPKGYFDFLGKSGSNVIASGWAFDPDAPNDSISVHLYIDGGYATSVTANQSRPDVNSAYGISGNHGFTIIVPASYLNGVNHTYRIYAINNTGNGNPELSSSPKSGSFYADIDKTISRYGWGVRVRVTNPSGTGAWIDNIQSQMFSNDWDLAYVVANIKSFLTTNGNTLVSGSLTPTNGSSAQYNNGGITTTVTVSDPSVNFSSNFNNGSVSLRIDNPVRDATWYQNMASSASSNNWTMKQLIDAVFAYQSSYSSVVSQTLAEYGSYVTSGSVVFHSTYNGADITNTFNITSAPFGTFDSVSKSGGAVLAQGWAIDPDNTNSPVTVKLYVDGVLAATQVTNVQRSDVNSAYGVNGNHGFSITVPSTYYNDSRSHTYRVYAVDSNTSITPGLSNSPISYTYVTLPCTLDGITMPSGSSTVAYLDNSIPYGNSCTGGGNSLTRTCTDGTLSGSVSYQYYSCVVEACIPSYYCSGNRVMNSCTGGVSQTCSNPYICSVGACVVLAPAFSPNVANATTGHLEAKPLLVRKGASTLLYWRVDNVTSCTVTGNGDSWTSAYAGASGKTTRPINSQTIYTLTCNAYTGANPSTVTEQVTVNVVPAYKEI